MICPILSIRTSQAAYPQNCKENKCGWWDAGRRTCSVVSIAEHFSPRKFSKEK